MSPFKLSLINPGNDDPDETVELDDDLAGKLKQVVDANPDLTLGEALPAGHHARGRERTDDRAADPAAAQRRLGSSWARRARTARPRSGPRLPRGMPSSSLSAS